MMCAHSYPSLASETPFLNLFAPVATSVSPTPYPSYQESALFLTRKNMNIDPSLPHLKQPKAVADSRTTAMMLVLEEILNPSQKQGRYESDPLLVSLDLEYSTSLNYIDQIGLAILDVAALSQQVAAERAISSRLLLLRRKCIARNQYTRQYLFGTPEAAVGGTLQDLLMPVFNSVDASGSVRDVILIGHGIASDFQAIKMYCGFDLGSVPSIKTVIDTSYISALMFDLPLRQLSLKKTCQMLKMNARQLHNAGNDAMYTLKALLLLFHRYKHQRLSIETDTINASAEAEKLAWQRRLDIIHQIGRCRNTVRLPPKRIRIRDSPGVDIMDDEESECAVFNLLIESDDCP